MTVTPSPPGTGDETNVRVAVRVRPQSSNELNEGLKKCTVVMPETRQILLGPEKSFTFDLVFDTLTNQDQMFQHCVASLVDGTLNGYNATILAYGQTGSGKTYTMGTASMDTPDENIGIIPRAVNRLFEKIEELKEECRSKNKTAPDFKVSAQFLELYNEEMNDLLHPSGKMGKSNIKIHEEGGNIYVSGASSRPVNNSEDCLKCLQIGSINRVTASTNMNATSSRSHAIFTLTVKQQRLSRVGDAGSADVHETTRDDVDNGELDFETLTAKFHFVDLAGSERLKRTGATGDRAKEGISINCELLALGNVISALGDVTKRGSYVPYRNSKLTRFLQDSLGGNSRTLMIACVGPSDRDFMETLNTLVYANRARNIKNKPSVNQDKASKQVSELKKRIAELEAELLQYKQGKLTADVCFMNDVSDENKLLLREQENLRDKIKNLQATIESKTEEVSILKSERDLAVLHSRTKAKTPDGEEVSHSDAIDELITQYMGEMERVKSKLTQVEIENSSYRKQLANLKSERIIPSVQLNNQSMNQTISKQTTNVDFTKIKEFENDLTQALAVAEADLAKKKEKLQSTCSNLDATAQISRSHSATSSSSRRRKQNKSLTNKDQDTKKSSRASSAATSCDERSLSESASERSNEVLTINGPGIDIDDTSNMENDSKPGKQRNDDSDAEPDDGDDTLDEDDDNGFSDSDADDNDNIDGSNPRLKISDIANITEEISAKEQLIAHIEKTQSALNSMRLGYDNKIAQLVSKMQNLETEKQHQLRNKDGSSKNAADVERIEKEYKRKVSALESEMKRMKSFEKINRKHLSELKQNEARIMVLKNEVEAKKLEKAKLVKQMKEESKKFRDKEMVQRKEVAQLRKHQRLQDHKIRALETENKQKNTVLQQKLREMEVIRKNKKPMSDKAAGLVSEKGRPGTAVGLKASRSFTAGRTIERSQSFRGKRGEGLSLVPSKESKVTSGSRKDQMSWEKFCSVLDEYVANSYSLAFSEKEMDEHMKERNRWYSEQKGVMNKLSSAKNNNSKDAENRALIARLNDELEVIKCSIEDIQERIEEKQASIVALNSARESFNELDPECMDGKTAKFLLQQMVNLAVERGVQQREESAKIKELEAQISEAELNKTIQQQLLDFVILDDQQASEKANEKNILDNMNCTFIKDAPDIVSSSMVSTDDAFGKDDMLTSTPAFNHPNVTIRKKKNRLNVDEMLYPRESLEGAKKESETPLMDKLGFQVMSAEELASNESSLSFPNMPKEISKVESSSNSSLVNEESSNLTSQLHKKANSLRCGLDSSDSVDVFQRLLRSVPRIDLGNGQMEVGSINFYRGSIPGLSSFPLKCQHVAEGHKKGVVSVDATESNLFTGSIDRSVKLWDLQTGSEIMSLLGFPHTVLQVRYHLPRKLLFTSSLHVIKIWDPLCKQSEMQCVQVLKSSGSCALAQDYPTPPTTKMPQGEDQINDIAFSSCGNLLYSVARNFIRIWDLRRLPECTESVQLLPMESHKATINVLSVKKKQEGPDLIFTGSRDHTIKCYEAISEPRSEGVCRSLDPPHMDGVESMCMYQDWLFTGSRDRCIKKWDISSIYSCRNIATSTNAHNHWITAMTMFPPTSSSSNDTPFLISGCRSGEIKVWDCTNFKSLGELKAHKAQINAFAKNSTCLFSASGDWDVKIWTRASDAGSSET